MPLRIIGNCTTVNLERSTRHVDYAFRHLAGCRLLLETDRSGLVPDGEGGHAVVCLCGCHTANLCVQEERKSQIRVVAPSADP